jgi:asparagine synthase (glutamine-hydrolysing)
MHSSNGRFVINFNGEIFNHAEIRRELEDRGFMPDGGWRGHSDTETFLEAISAWGLRKALSRAVGQFAFGLWDRSGRKLSLVRDRFGEKPLYYGWIGTDFVFASELKAIRCHPRCANVIDRRAVGLLAARNYIPAPLSIYRGLFKLQPGCILELNAEAARKPLADPPQVGLQSHGLSLERYWSYREVVRGGLGRQIASEGEALEQLEAALAQSIRGQALADVQVGAFLSGGIDSSTIVSLYQKYSTGAVETFTIGFNEAKFNEAEDAEAVAKHLGTRHHQLIITDREAQEVIPMLPRIYDEPFADSSQIPTYLLSRFARKRVKVAMSGDGGDELLGGYNRYIGTARLWTAVKHLPRPLRAMMAGAAGLIPCATWNSAGRILTRREVPYFGEKVQKSLRTVARAGNLRDLLEHFLDEWGGEENWPVYENGGKGWHYALDADVGAHAPDAVRMMYADVLSYLPGDILCKVDRASMAASLETRAPLLDHRVAEVAARIPIQMKIHGGSGKHILKQLLYREAPRELFERPKAGFGIPVGEWLRGPLRDWAEDLLNPAKMRAEGWLDPNPIAARWQQHVTGRRDSTASLWAILMFQAWLREQERSSATVARSRTVLDLTSV